MSTITKGNAVKPIAIIHPGRLSCSFNSIADVATALEAAGYVVAVGLTGNGAAIEAIGPRLYRGTRAVYHEHRAAGRSISASLIVAVRHYLGLPYTKLRDPPIPCFEGTSEALARFAALVAEACAQVAEDVDAGGCSDPAELVKAIRAAFPMPKT